MDGRSLLPFVEEPERSHGRELLIEQSSPTARTRRPRGPSTQAIRTSHYVYVAERAAGRLELYDLEIDPYQLENQAANPAYDEVEGGAGRAARERS